MTNRDVSGFIQARAGRRLVFGLINPDNDGVYQRIWFYASIRSAC